MKDNVIRFDIKNLIIGMFLHLEILYVPVYTIVNTLDFLWKCIEIKKGCASFYFRGRIYIGAAPDPQIQIGTLPLRYFQIIWKPLSTAWGPQESIADDRKGIVFLLQVIALIRSCPVTCTSSIKRDSPLHQCSTIAGPEQDILLHSQVKKL